ncbi:hypothetical protein BpHYR1_013132 [Brachionus plicatilis]|uniref:Uncharacterized protein n=1 Tax=Brachionus plicatilis TaxID=10195 RepID=A0A3M7Q8S6_BRAPC|nr:hypothetical protein BpHYR1_013132 [Brachionus plicatilis]
MISTVELGRFFGQIIVDRLEVFAPGLLDKIVSYGDHDQNKDQQNQYKNDHYKLTVDAIDPVRVRVERTEKMGRRVYVNT